MNCTRCLKAQDRRFFRSMCLRKTALHHRLTTLPTGRSRKDKISLMPQPLWTLARFVHCERARGNDVLRQGEWLRRRSLQ
mmetsp:Transcript_55855/g.86822  ORF Transcript_55855/g.86822 Transcript_55855/m.86822 type:complete len:80 (+) Transcript_55855:62-301(+)